MGEFHASKVPFFWPEPCPFFRLRETLNSDQLSSFMDINLNQFLAAFRKWVGCHSTLLRLLEDWRKALDTYESVAAILMDLARAFNSLHYSPLIAKLKAYGQGGGRAT